MAPDAKVKKLSLVTCSFMASSNFWKCLRAGSCNSGFVWLLENSLSSYSMGSLAILGCSEITQTFWMVEMSHALRLGTQHSGAGRCQPPAFGVRWLQDVQSVRGAPSASPIKFAEALQCLRCSAFRWW